MEIIFSVYELNGLVLPVALVRDVAGDLGKELYRRYEVSAGNLIQTQYVVSKSLLLGAFQTH